MSQKNILKKEVIVLMGASLVTLILAILVLRWLAPGLLGMSVQKDLQVVQLDQKLPPFFEGVFRDDDYRSRKFILKDPITRVRAKPLIPSIAEGGLGPNDILGFRNHSVPNRADVVVIGDSQTYGNNARLEENWPGHMRAMLTPRPIVYNMSVGGWGAPQYQSISRFAANFRPKVVVVAYYTGNDPIESFQVIHGMEYWRGYITNPTLGMKDLPKVKFPPPKSGWWPVWFGDNIRTIFTPSLRLHSNTQTPVVKAGYKIMEDTARRIHQMYANSGIKLVFTIIPTKELVYVEKVKAQKFEPPAAYSKLVMYEAAYIRNLSIAIKALPDVVYVDLVTPLQKAASGKVMLYPQDENGHPASAGYKVIGSEIAAAISGVLQKKP